MTATTGLIVETGDEFAAYQLDKFVAWLRSWGAANDTIRHRLSVLRSTLPTWPDPTKVTTHDLAEFLGNPAFSAWTRLTYHGHLRSLFKWLTETGVIATDPTIGLKRPSTPKNKPRPLTPAEEARALEHADGDLRAWLILGLYAGLRSHEAAKIHGSHVTVSSLFVCGKGGKEAILPTHPLVWELAEVRPRDSFWFPGGYGHGPRARPHITSEAVTMAVTRHFRRLGIEGSYHRCRHTYGTNLLRGGVNLRVVQELMRHESLATTAAYLAVDEDERQAAIRRLTSVPGVPLVPRGDPDVDELAAQIQLRRSQAR